jgi:hypothetical protein
MPVLFELTELVTYLQKPSLPTDIAELARELTEVEIRNHIGASIYDAYTDLRPFKLQALIIAKRVVFNPEGLRRERIDDYEYEISIEDLMPPELTQSEMDRLDALAEKIAGKTRAHSIRPKAPTPQSCVTAPASYCNY